MKFFKKALAIFFAMIFVLSLTISAFAVEIKNPTLELNVQF